MAVTTAKRVTLLPDYPTIAELGYSGYQAGNWYGLAVPVRTPTETIIAIRAAAVAAMNNDSVSKRLADLGYVSIGDQPQEFAAHLKAEIASLAKILREYRITADNVKNQLP